MPVSYRESDDRYVVKCGKSGCLLAIAVNTSDAATELDKHHECPHQGGGTSHYSWGITLTLVSQMFDMMDVRFVELLEVEEEAASADKLVRSHELKAELGVLAEATALFMPPHLGTRKLITKEIIKRKQKRDAGEKYETFGEHVRIYEPVPGVAQRAGDAVPSSRRSDPPSTPVELLDDDTTKKIKEALASKMFKPGDLAKVFDVSEAVVLKVARDMT